MAHQPLILTLQLGGQNLSVELGSGTVVLGRAPDCDVVVAEPAVSRRHAEIRCEGDRYLLRDLGSSNGTRLNGTRIEGDQPLKPGDRIGLAKAELVIESAGDDEQEPSPMTTNLSIADSVPSKGVEVSWREIEDMRGGRTDRRERLFGVLVEAGELLTTARSPEALYEPVLDLVGKAFTPERALLLMVDDPEREPDIAASRIASGQGEGNIVLSRTVIRRVLTEKVSLLIEDPALQTSTDAMQSIIAQGIRAAMAVPLVDEGKVAGVLYADSTDPAARYTRDDLKAFSLLAGVVGTAFTHVRYQALETEKRRLDAEVDAARNIMATILPDSLPEVADYELTAHLESCNEVGGDLYDLIALDDGRLLVVAGDVTGKGLGAALLVSSIVPLLRTLIETERDPLELVIRLNRHLWRTTDTIHFATLFLGILDPATGRLDYVNAGHNPPYLLDGAGELDSLPATGPPVGMLADVAFAAESVELPPGTTLVLYSDGVSEAGAGGDPEAAFYGEGRFEERLRSLVGRDAAEMAREALADVEDFLGGADPDDDVTLVLVQRRAAS